MEREYSLERYSRQVPLIGTDGQIRLLRSTVLVAGAGGLGSSALLYLVAAGVGHVIVVDRGRVDLPDLNRQVLYDEEDLGELKALAAWRRLRKLNSSTTVESYAVDIADPSIESLVAKADVVIDCLDNWPSRFVLNELAVKHLKPLVHAGVQGYYGQTTTIIPGKTPCLRCLLVRPPGESVGVVPVIGFVTAILGAIEVGEAIKLLLGEEPALAGELLVVDLKNMEFSKLRVSRRADCPVCGRLGPHRGSADVNTRSHTS